MAKKLNGSEVRYDGRRWRGMKDEMLQEPPDQAIIYSSLSTSQEGGTEEDRS